MTMVWLLHNAAETLSPAPESSESNANVGPRIFMVAPQGPDLKEYALRVPERLASRIPFSVLTNESLDHGMGGKEEREILGLV